LSDIIINKNLKLSIINYLSRKVDVLFHFPSRSQNPCNRTYVYIYIYIYIYRVFHDFLNAINRLLVTNKEHLAFPSANNCQGQLRASQSLSVV